MEPYTRIPYTVRVIKFEGGRESAQKVINELQALGIECKWNGLVETIGYEESELRNHFPDELFKLDEKGWGYRIRPGDWIVFELDDKIEVYDNEYFIKRYTPMAPNA